MWTPKVCLDVFDTLTFVDCKLLGSHVVQLFTQYAPYKLKSGESWDTAADAYVESVLNVIEQYAPGFKASIVRVPCSCDAVIASG